jgi:hypothetical protein
VGACVVHPFNVGQLVRLKLARGIFEITVLKLEDRGVRLYVVRGRTGEDRVVKEGDLVRA